MPDVRLSIRDLVAGYKPGFPILHGVSMDVCVSEVVTLIGPNGAGKSTLVKAVAGLVEVEGGTVTLDGKLITSIRADRLAAHSVAYVPQTANIFQKLTIEQNLVLSARRMAGDRVAAVARMFELFEPLEERRSIRAGGLSGGQRQMLAIAMALVISPILILMDEPTAGLAPKAAQEVLALIRSITANGVSVLLVEQNAKAALAISDRGYVLAEGQLQHEGTGKKLLHDPRIGEIYLGTRRRAAS